MQTRYDDLDLQFTIDGVHFQVLNMVFEQFERMIPLHSHSKYCYELHYIPYGEGTVTLQGTSHALSAGMLYVTGPHIEHEQHTSEAAPMAEYCVFLRAVRERGARRSTSSIAARFLETTCWIGTDRQNLHPLFQQLFQELHTRDPGFHTVTIALLEQLIVQMTRNYADPLVHGSAAAPQPVPVTQKSILIDECFLYEYATLTLPVLAQRLSLSVRQTQRLLSEQYDRTFQQKRTEARMHAAATFLTTTGMTIAEIAERVGYSSPEHFANAFRKAYHESPGSFRKHAHS